MLLASLKHIQPLSRSAIAARLPTRCQLLPKAGRIHQQRKFHAIAESATQPRGMPIRTAALLFKTEHEGSPQLRSCLYDYSRPTKGAHRCKTALLEAGILRGHRSHSPSEEPAVHLRRRRGGRRPRLPANHQPEGQQRQPLKNCDLGQLPSTGS